MNKFILAFFLAIPAFAQTNLGSVTTQNLNGVATPNLSAGTDNSTIINNAISSVGTTGKVVLPPGVWNIASTIKLPRGVILQGSGPEATVLNYMGSGVALYHGDSNGGFAAQRGGIRDLGIQLNSLSRNSGTIGIFCGGDPSPTSISPSSDYCQNVFYDNLLIQGFDIGYKHGNNSFWITFTNPTIRLNNIGATAATGVSDSGEAINWFGGRLDDNYTGAFVDDPLENNLFGTAIDFNGYGTNPQVSNSYISATSTHWEVHTGPMAQNGTIRLRGGYMLVDDSSPSLSYLISTNLQQNNISIDGMEIYSAAPVANLVNWANGVDPSSQLILRHLTGNHNTAISSLANLIPGNLDVELDSYFGGATNSAIGITTTKSIGPCTLVIKSGLITSITGC